MKYKGLLVSILLLCLMWGQAWAETLYVRSSAVCPNNGNGTAYECAASAGAAGAFNSSANANVLWGAGTGSVSIGDTLYICGTITNFAVTPTLSGTAGNQIVISGACPSDPGSISGGAGNNFSINITSLSYITVEDAAINWAHRDALFVGIADTAGADHTGIIVRRNRINNIGATTVANHCHAVYFNSITGTAAAWRINNVTFTNNTITGTEPACASSNNDNVNMENLGTGAVIRDNESYGGHEGFDISTGTGLAFERNNAHDNTHAGAKLHGIMGCGIGNKVIGNVFADNEQWGLIWQDQELGTVANNTIKHAGVYHGLDVQSVNTWGATCVPAGNTYASNYISADYNAGSARIYNTTRADFEANNTWDGNVLRQVGSQTTLIYWTGEAGRTNDVTTANFAAGWGATHTLDQQQTDPQWVGGTSPTTAAGFKLKKGSALRRAGKGLGIPVSDYAGRPFYPSAPSIGAYEITSNSEAEDRTTATARTARN